MIGFFNKASDAHVLSIVTMVNEKFRERVYAWVSFKENSTEFPGLFDHVLRLLLSDKLSFKEQTNLMIFLDNCINSLEVDLIRTQVQKICGLPMWASLSKNRREFEFEKFSKLRKYWKAIEKNDAKVTSEDEKAKINFQRTFLRKLLEKFINIVNSFAIEAGEIQNLSEKRAKLNYLERFLELLIDLEALLPTRRFFNSLLDDTNLIIHCQLSSILKEKETYGVDESRLFCQLLNILKFYSGFEIDDQSGEAFTEAQMCELHYEHLKALQKGVFKYFREDLQIFSLTSIAQIDTRDKLIKFLQPLSIDRLYALAEYLHFVPLKDENHNQDEFSKELLIEIIISHTERRESQLNELNSLPLYPNEEVIWDENIVPTDYYSGDSCLALPKLNLQFLTLHDYLLRNFTLFRLEAAYEIRQDIEDAVVRMRPYHSFEEETTCFSAWSRMAHPITNFNVVEIGEPKVGEKKPSRVRADVTVNMEYTRVDVKAEWEALRRHDIGFLVTLRAPNPPEKRYDPKEPFIPQVGLIYVRGCEIEGIVGDDGKVAEEGLESKTKVTGDKRTWRVFLDPSQYRIDTDKLLANPNSEDVYSTFNVFVRRRPKENNFKAVLESIRDLMNTNFVVPEWLRDILLGYGDPASANYKNLKQKMDKLDWNDTFLTYEHLLNSFPDYKIEAKNSGDLVSLVPPFRLTFSDLPSESGEIEDRKIIVETYKKPNQGPYPANQPKKNAVPFTPTQIEAIKSGMQPGLTMVVGPPGTGKTDVAVQIISNIYHNFPDQRTLIVTHSNQALNQLFEKIMALDIDERHLLRLGHGEEALETEKDFSRYGRVNYVLSKRIELLGEVDRLQKSLEIPGDIAYSCETSTNFYITHIVSRWEQFKLKLKDSKTIESIEKHFPFTKFFENAPQPLFKKTTFEEDYEISQGCYRYIKKVFQQLDEFRAFELMRNMSDRAEYLLVKEAKIIAMTCTHAALKRRDLVKYGFRYDNILMEEAAQILEIETFIPLLLQNPDHNGNNRLKRWIMIGDHHQLPPVIKNMAFQKYSNMEQSLFTRLVKLGVPTVDLDAQGRARPSLCNLFKWRYRNLGNLAHITQQNEFKRANAGFEHEFQLINVDDYNGQGETEPQPFFYQNVAEAEYITAVYMYMRLIGYPAELITILTTYNGQKHLIRDIIRKRCASNPLLGLPKKVTTVDKYQGQQNDYILLSLVKTKNIGHLRDVRRLIVAMSRARLGLYIFARVSLFKSCYELTPVFNILLERSTKLMLLPSESYPTKRELTEKPEIATMIMEDMPQMAQFVYDYYQNKLKLYEKLRKQQANVDKKEQNELRLKQLNEEEERLRKGLEAQFSRIIENEAKDETSSTSSGSLNSDEDSSSEDDGEKIVVQDKTSEVIGNKEESDDESDIDE